MTVWLHVYVDIVNTYMCVYIYMCEYIHTHIYVWAHTGTAHMYLFLELWP